MKRIFAFLTLALLFSFAKIFAAIPDRPIGYVSDFAHVLTDTEASQLNSYLAQYENATTNQIAVVVVSSLEGLTIEDYSIQLAEKWKVGKKGKDNGVLFLIAIADHKMRIEVGYGLEGKLTDADSGEIIRNVVAPYFRRNQFAEGVFAGLQAITEKIDGQPFQGSGTPTVPQTQTGGSSGLRALIGILILLFIWIFVFRLLGLWSLPLLLSSGTGGGGFWGGSGGFFGGGGGFGGGGWGGFSGGGGSFGGGGASGGW